VRVDGSSTVLPISEAVAEELQKRERVIVTVAFSGTGGGMKRLCAGEIDVAGASRPMRASERARCAARGVEPVELPVAYDGITVVVSPANDWVDHLTVAELARMWAPAAQGRVTRWSDVRPGWPDRPLHLYGAGVDSGTFEHFTEAVVGRARASRGDYTASEDDHVLIAGVARDELALGYFGFGYFEQHAASLRAVPIDVDPHDGVAPVAPYVGSIRDGSYRPLSRPIFLYTSRGALARPEVSRFVSFYLDEGRRSLVREVGYVPLSDRAYELVAERARRGTQGSLYPGVGEVTASLDELLVAAARGAP
jgi:phosphate transport system substrate-binding protein